MGEPDYKQMTREDLHEILLHKVRRMRTEDVLALPGVQDALREALHAELVKDWEFHFPGKAFKNDPDVIVIQPGRPFSDWEMMTIHAVWLCAQEGMSVEAVTASAEKLLRIAPGTLAMEADVAMTAWTERPADWTPKDSLALGESRQRPVYDHSELKAVIDSAVAALLLGQHDGVHHKDHAMHETLKILLGNEYPKVMADIPGWDAGTPA